MFVFGRMQHTQAYVSTQAAYVRHTGSMHKVVHEDLTEAHASAQTDLDSGRGKALLHVRARLKSVCLCLWLYGLRGQKHAPRMCA